MKTARIINIDTGTLIARQAVIADTFWARLKGLLGKKEMLAGEALIISPCNMVHCLGMKINIDVIFLTGKGEVVKIIENMRPGQISPYIRKADYVIELRAREAERCGTRVGHRINLKYK